MAERFAFYWEDNRVVIQRLDLREIIRPNFVLLTTVEGRSILEDWPGPDYRRDRHIAAHYLLHGLPYPPKGRFDTPPPSGLLDALEEVVEAAARRTCEQMHFDEGERMTLGALFTRLRDTEVRRSGWAAKFVAQGYSGATKDPETGADGGLLIDVQDEEGHRVIKAIWLQAKRNRKKPHDVNKLPDLADQRERMSRFTRQNYALLFTPDQAYVYESGQQHDTISVGVMTKEAVKCLRGDPDPEIVVKTLGYSHLLSLRVGPEPV